MANVTLFEDGEWAGIRRRYGEIIDSPRHKITLYHEGLPAEFDDVRAGVDAHTLDNIALRRGIPTESTSQGFDADVYFCDGLAGKWQTVFQALHAADERDKTHRVNQAYMVTSSPNIREAARKLGYWVISDDDIGKIVEAAGKNG